MMSVEPKHVAMKRQRLAVILHLYLTKYLYKAVHWKASSGDTFQGTATAFACTEATLEIFSRHNQ